MSPGVIVHLRDFVEKEATISKNNILGFYMGCLSIGYLP